MDKAAVKQLSPISTTRYLSGAALKSRGFMFAPESVNKFCFEFWISTSK